MPIKLLIIGGGASGLMAAATAAELQIPALLLERRHRLGLKLLMCGNNRCNVSHDFSVDDMVSAYGGEIGDFLRPALTAFSPSELRRWFAGLNLKTVVKHDHRIYPATENADDVLHAFTDYLRDKRFPYALNCPVASIKRVADGFAVQTENGLEFQCEKVLVATGGVSYPKTGSVGDGLKFASSLGLKTTPLRGGLVAVESNLRWLEMTKDTDIPDVGVKLLDARGHQVASLRGNLLCNPGILRGSAIFDATRLAAHENMTSFRLVLDLFPKGPALLDRLPREVALGLKNAGVREYRQMEIHIAAVRPLKEAIVTVGGVALDEVEPQTMQCKKIPGLYFTGETLDIDGPTGGFNLHAAFATGRLAVTSMAPRVGKTNEKPHIKWEKREEPPWKKSRSQWDTKPRKRNNW